MTYGACTSAVEEVAVKGVAAMGVAAEAKAAVGCSQTKLSLVQLVSPCS